MGFAVDLGDGEGRRIDAAEGDGLALVGGDGGVLGAGLNADALGIELVEQIGMEAGEGMVGGEGAGRVAEVFGEVDDQVVLAEPDVGFGGVVGVDLVGGDGVEGLAVLHLATVAHVLDVAGISGAEAGIHSDGGSEGKSVAGNADDAGGHEPGDEAGDAGEDFVDDEGKADVAGDHGIDDDPRDEVGGGKDENEGDGGGLVVKLGGEEELGEGLIPPEGEGGGEGGEDRGDNRAEAP